MAKKKRPGPASKGPATKSAPQKVQAPPARSAKAHPRAGQNLVELFSQAEMLAHEGDPAKVRALYDEWLGANPGHPLAHAALFNQGCSQMNAAPEVAEACFREALRLLPNFLQARYNLGTTLERLGRIPETLEAWSHLTALPDASTGLEREMLLYGLNHSGRVLEQQRRFREAEQMLARSLRVDPTQRKVIHHWVHLRQKQCAWPVFAELPGLDAAAMRGATSALAMLDVTDDPEVQLSAAHRFVAEHITPGLEPLARPGGYGHKRLRIGYLSSDLCLHPVAMLMVELFERHHRDRVEVYGYCWSREDGSDLRRRVIAALDRHVPIGQMNDEQAALRIRADEIDVLIDLHGPTAGARPNILARRPALVQASYLGFPGTSGMPCIDYVLCDREVLPEATLPFMTEKPLYLPEVFQVCDTRRVASPAPSRASCGLPETGAVFCVFNNSHKITPELFGAWLNILTRTPGSVLWLVADDPSVRENLTREAEARGLAERLIFAPRAAPPDYLARYATADLFLDCFPFNGGTTANDALYMNLPIVTLEGRAFASRMAGALLKHLGLGELVAGTLQQYEDLAVELGNNPQRLAELRQHLARARAGAALFDTGRQAGHIEDLLCAAHAEAVERTRGQAAPEAAATAPVQAQAPVQTPGAAHLEREPDVHLYHIAYSEETLRDTPPGYRALDNLASPRNDWREFWPIRNFLKTEALDDGAFYGFFSPRFQEKTGLTAAHVRGFVREHAASPANPVGADVFTFSPQPDMSAFFLNIFEQGEVFHPGLLEASRGFLRAAGLGVDVGSLVMDSRQIVFSNYLVARPAFWRQWLALADRLFEVCEGDGPEHAELRALLTGETTYKGAVQRKVFVQERLASLILTIQPQWRVKAYNTFACAWSGTPLNQFKHEAVVSDALKIAMREHGFKDYMDAYSAIRDKLRG